MMSVLGRKSFLSMDQVGRLDKWKRVFRQKEYGDERLNHCVVSDSCLQERLKDMDIEQLRNINYEILHEGLRTGYILPVGMVDGTRISEQWSSCLSFKTKTGGSFLVDMEMYDSLGKELEASEKLIKRMHTYTNEGSIDLLLLDMLYFNERITELYESKIVKDILIKYTPDKNNKNEPKVYRLILKEVEKILHVYKKQRKSKHERLMIQHKKIEYIEGFDKERMASYKIYTVECLSYDNRFKVARVEEYYPKKKQHTIFYVITTKKELRANQMREYGHDRWIIENNGFKMLSAQVESKHQWSNDKSTIERLLLIWFAAFDMLWLFVNEMEKLIRQKLNYAKLTVNCMLLLFQNEDTTAINQFWIYNTS